MHQDGLKELLNEAAVTESHSLLEERLKPLRFSLTFQILKPAFPLLNQFLLEAN